MDSDTQRNILHAHYMNDLTATDYLVSYKNIRELIEERFEKIKDDEYIVFYDEEGNKTALTYEKFVYKVHALSRYLSMAGVEKETRIATFSHNHLDTVILYFACWSIGAVVVPINVNEDRERVKYILNHSSTKIVFTRRMYLDRLMGMEGDFQVVVFEKEDYEGQVLFKTPVALDYDFDKECEAMIVYTSGTTGNPKGVVLTQYNLMVDAGSIAQWHDVKRGDTMMCVLPIHHVNGTIVTIMTSMFAGARLVLNQKFQTDKFFERLEKERVKIVSVVPTLLQFLIHSGENISKYKLPAFSHIICGAGPLTCEIAHNFESKFGLRIVHGYGLSETTCYSCFIPRDLSADEHDKWQNEYGFPAIGIPLDCNEMDIHDEKGTPLGENKKGEIVIRGHNVMKYYFDNPEVNAKTFEFGWFRSGDEGFFKYDGSGNKYFFITGRLKELIIRGGVNISPLEIDEVLCKVPCIESGIAVGFENDWYGEEVGALVLLKEEYKNNDEGKLKEEILSFCRERLPFHKTPKTVVFSDTIPVTSTGKYQRNKVKDKFARYKTEQFRP